MRKPWLIGGVGAVIAALVTAGVMASIAKSRSDAKDKKPEVTLEFTPAEVVRPLLATMPERVEFSGPLMAPRTAVVRAKAAGTLLGLSVQLGGARHQATVTHGGKAAVQLPQFRAVNTLLGNLKTAIAGTYHAFRFAKYAHRYLAEFQYRFNRRFDMKTILPRLLLALLAAPASPEWRLRSAEIAR